jgi:hypothetical protein
MRAIMVLFSAPSRRDCTVPDSSRYSHPGKAEPAAAPPPQQRHPKGRAALRASYRLRAILSATMFAMEHNEIDGGEGSVLWPLEVYYLIW